MRLPVQIAECCDRGEGAPEAEVANQVLVEESYSPPVSRNGGLDGEEPAEPPQTIIRLPVQTAVWPRRAAGALTREVGLQASAIGSYRPPVFIAAGKKHPPQTIILLPVQTVVLQSRS